MNNLISDRDMYSAIGEAILLKHRNPNTPCNICLPTDAMISEEWATIAERLGIRIISANEFAVSKINE